MGLKNYTSKVPASQSIRYIEGKLVSKGATQIAKSYDKDKRVERIRFTLKIDGSDMLFNLPARFENCERVMTRQLSNRAKAETRRKVPAQAERTAWKILADWVDAQMAMIELAQVDVMEVFLPYAYDPATQMTFFEQLKAKDFRPMLPGGVNNEGD